MRITKAAIIALLVGVSIQIATAWNSFFYQSDEYFQIIEFAGRGYNITPSTSLTWEFGSKIRPTLQIHTFACFYKLLTAIGIHDRFVILSILNILMGISFFIVSNYLIYDRFKNKRGLAYLFWLNNLFWIVPYIRCRFSAETTGAFFWILGVLMMEKHFTKEKSGKSSFFLFLIGIVFALSFYCRFQILFALVGVVCWFLVKHRNEWHRGLTVVSGFATGLAINIILDRIYYGEWVITPYRYFVVNILDGKANSFGTAPWWYYIVILLLITIPFAGFVLFSFFAKGLTLYRTPFALASLFFIIGHSIIGHKEERFMFPVIPVIVYLAAEAFYKSPYLVEKIKLIWNHFYFGRLVRIGCYLSITLNVMLVILLAAETYKQPILFIKHFNENLLKDEHVISFKQHPYETESGLRYTFLSENKYDQCIQVVSDKERFIETLQQHPDYKYCILLKDAKEYKLEYLLEDKHAIVASSLIWNMSCWLAKKYNILIPDLWICQTFREVKQV